MTFDWLFQLLVCLFQGSPDGGFSTSWRANQHGSYSLFGSLIKLQNFVELIGQHLKILLLEDSSNRLGDLLVYNVFDADAREDIFNQDVEFEHICEGEFADGVDSESLDEDFTLGWVVDVWLLFKDQPACNSEDSFKCSETPIVVKLAGE